MMVRVPLLLLSAALGLAPQAGPVVQRLTLSNGLRVLVVPRGNVPWCAVATVLPGGSTTDPGGRSGLAHLAEHLLFEDAHDGTRRDAEAEALGMLSNAFTLEDYTVVVEEFSPAVLEEALGVHASRLGARGVTPEQLAREKRVVADERRFRVDEPPLGAADERLLTALWQGHARARPVLGWPAEVNAITPSDVRGWMDRALQPRAAVTVVVGAVDPVVLGPLLERTLGRWKGAPGVTPAAAAPPGALEGQRRQTMAGVEPALLVAVPAAPSGSASAAAELVLARLMHNVPEELAGPPLDVEVRPGHAGGVVVITATGTDDAPPREGQVDAVLELLAHGTFPPEALDAARTAAVWSLVRTVQTHAFLAERMAADEALLGKVDDVHALQVRLRAVTAADVRARARAWREGPRSVVMVDPQSGTPP